MENEFVKVYLFNNNEESNFIRDLYYLDKISKCSGSSSLDLVFANNFHELRAIKKYCSKYDIIMENLPNRGELDNYIYVSNYLHENSLKNYVNEISLLTRNQNLRKLSSFFSKDPFFELSFKND